MKITTKSGDTGETSLFGGKKVSKNSPVIEVIGALDELQAFIGFCKFVVGFDDGKDICKILDKVQDDLYRMMSVVGFEMEHPENIKEISEKDLEYLEKEGKKHEGEIKDLHNFVKPGTSEASSRFQIARTVCRRVERRMVEFEDAIGLPDLYLKYLNRLSDLLFVLAYKFEAR